MKKKRRRKDGPTDGQTGRRTDRRIVKRKDGSTGGHWTLDRPSYGGTWWHLDRGKTVGDWSKEEGWKTEKGRGRKMEHRLNRNEITAKK